MQRNFDCLEQREVWSEENEKLLHKVYQNRMKTTYQISYCNGRECLTVSSILK
jgi:hypothetical protein